LKLRSWLLFLFGSLLVTTSLAHLGLARHQARQNLVKAAQRELDVGARPAFEPALIDSLRLLTWRIFDSSSLHGYRNVFVSLNSPYQMLRLKQNSAELLSQLGQAQSDDGKTWTASDFVARPKSEDAYLNECWQALQGILRDVGVTFFEEAQGTLDLLILTDRDGFPIVEMRSQGKRLPQSDDLWSEPRLTAELQQFLSQNPSESHHGYLLHGDGQLYFVRVQPFESGGQLLLGHRLDETFEDGLSKQIPAAEFRLHRSGSVARPLNHPPYLSHAESLPALVGGDSGAQLIEYRSLGVLEAYLKSLSSGTLGLSLGVLGLGLVGIVLATQSVSRQMSRLSRRMQEVGEGQLEGDLQEAGPLELRAATRSFNQMLQQLRHKEMLAKMVPKQAREAIEHEQTAGGRVLGRRLRSTILFSDIRGFTNLSERLPPQELMGILDIYLSRMTSIIDRHGGDVNEYIGDAILADFEDRPEEPGALRATRAAFDMVLELEKLRQEKIHPELEQLRQGLGLHTGEVVKGEVGASHRSKFALIGDTVNLAARIQDRSRDGKHTGILLSDAARADVRGFELALFGDESFKGKSGQTRVWEVVGPTDARADEREPASESDSTADH
jgi:class 3 adenylate cyclase